jgi:hypothetical protein
MLARVTALKKCLLTVCASSKLIPQRTPRDAVLSYSCPLRVMAGPRPRHPPPRPPQQVISSKKECDILLRKTSGQPGMTNPDALRAPTPPRYAAVPHNRHPRLCWGSLPTGNGNGVKMTFQRAVDHIEWRRIIKSMIWLENNKNAVFSVRRMTKAAWQDRPRTGWE